MKDISCETLWDFVFNPNTGAWWKPEKKLWEIRTVWFWTREWNSKIHQLLILVLEYGSSSMPKNTIRDLFVARTEQLLSQFEGAKAISHGPTVGAMDEEICKNGDNHCGDLYDKLY